MTIRLSDLVMKNLSKIVNLQKFLKYISGVMEFSN